MGMADEMQDMGSRTTEFGVGDGTRGGIKAKLDVAASGIVVERGRKPHYPSSAGSVENPRHEFEGK